jgi:hypothetical protein
MEILLVQPENKEQLKAVKAVLKLMNINFTSRKETTYKPEFIKKIQESQQQAKDGKVTTIAVEDLWK